MRLKELFALLENIGWEYQLCVKTSVWGGGLVVGSGRRFASLLPCANTKGDSSAPVEDGDEFWLAAWQSRSQRAAQCSTRIHGGMRARWGTITTGRGGRVDARRGLRERICHSRYRGERLPWKNVSGVPDPASVIEQCHKAGENGEIRGHPRERKQHKIESAVRRFFNSKQNQRRRTPPAGAEPQ